MWRLALVVAAGASLLAACGHGDSETDPTATRPPGASVDTWYGVELLPSGLSWQWQLTGDIDTSVEADVFDIDLFDAGDEDIEALQERNVLLICYVSVGTSEEWRPDAGDFPGEVLGERYDEYPDERWLDVSRIDLLGPVVEARLDLCVARGFDAVEADNVDGWDNETGFDISRAEQLAFLRWISDAAHARGLAVGLKNVPGFIAEAEPYFDFLVTEDCFADGWCEAAVAFVETGKPVFAAEYTNTDIDFEEACDEAAELGISMILKDRDLDAWREGC
jgi:hypothetical protein